MKFEELPEFLTIDEACSLLRVSRDNLLRYIRSKRIKAVELSKQYKLVPKVEIQRLISHV